MDAAWAAVAEQLRLPPGVMWTASSSKQADLALVHVRTAAGAPQPWQPLSPAAVRLLTQEMPPEDMLALEGGLLSDASIARLIDTVTNDAK